MLFNYKLLILFQRDLAENIIMKKTIILLVILFTIGKVYATEKGYASWYGGKFHGRQTANGEIFNTNKLTAAHKKLPFNTLVKVTNINNIPS